MKAVTLVYKNGQVRKYICQSVTRGEKSFNLTLPGGIPFAVPEGWLNAPQCTMVEIKSNENNN